ncbi:MAG: hypothetical protein LBR56_00995 [Sporomusaceae bacterium]|jgi:hypothetical protein|nr:hypothetical protein [Sporomusaceae bacterium]
MKILQYLTWFGEDAIKRGTILYSLAYAVQTVLDAIEAKVNYLTKQIYLMSAEGEWLDRWAWDLARLKRKPLEGDEVFRMRLILALLRIRNIRKSIIQVIKIMTGAPPVEIFEPIRDTAFWNRGYFFIPKRQIDVAAATDGSGAYCARTGTSADTSHTGYVRVRLAADYHGGAGISHYDSLDTYDSKISASSITDIKKGITKNEIVEAVYAVQPAGTRIFVEFIN